MRNMLQRVTCDGPKCESTVSIPISADASYIPDNWIRTIMTSDEFVWETKYYDLCSVKCLEALKDEVSSLVYAANGESDNWTTDDLEWGTQ